MLLAPSLVLTNLSIVYALVTPSCALQSTLALHAVSAFSLLACALMTWPAWRNWRAQADARHQADDAVAYRRPFMALVAWMSGALSCLVVLAQWFPMWILSPCIG